MVIGFLINSQFFLKIVLDTQYLKTYLCIVLNNKIFFNLLKSFIMKKSTYVLCFAVVIVFFAILTYIAFTVNNGNAGLHFN